MIYGIDMQIRQIGEDEKVIELFDRYLPGMRAMAASNKEAGGLSIRMLAKYMRGAVSQETLEVLDAELKKIGEENGGISPAERKRIQHYQEIAARDAETSQKEEVFTNNAVRPGNVWLDTKGNRIEAHAGGIIYEDGVYYWYGENKAHTDGKSAIWTWGIRMYSSRDFYNWTDMGLIIPPVLDDPQSDLFPEKRVDRPHIVKNERTGKYVCWLKLCGASASFTVLTADHPAGPYTIVKEHYNPFGLDIGDFDISINKETKTAYLYCEAEHDMVAGIRLNETYTEGEEIVSRQYEHLRPPFCREGVTVFEREGRLYMLTSGMTGYVPNQSDAAVSDGHELPFESIGDPHVNDPSAASFNSQIGQVFKVPGKKELYVALADRWVPDYVVDARRADVLRRAIAANHDPEHYQVTDAEKEELKNAPMLESANTHLATYVMLPIRFEDGQPRIEWKDSWRLEDYEDCEAEPAIYGTFEEKESALELANRTLARRAAEESIVLLKNDGALPLQSERIALYGMGARKTVKGGLGSGSVEERHSVTIEEGLKTEGYEIVSNSWLDDYDREYEETYAAYVEMVEKAIEGMTNPMEIIPKAHSYVYRYPSGRDITDEDIVSSATDTCIYVLMRQAGEGNDRRLEEGDYLLTETERRHLTKLGAAYRHTIVVINIGGGVDLGFLDEIPGIDAVVSFVQGGEEGGNALARLLSGKVNFSGRLASTLMKSYQDVPFGDEFSYQNGNLDEENYKEGIYVGYRYYDSFGKEVRYPFGYGLSYTQFDMQTQNVWKGEDRIHMSVCVTNVGNVYPGKEVVQVYVSAPEVRLKKEYQSLICFAKTPEIAPGGSAVVEMTFDIAQMASYDDAGAAWILEPGKYILRVGDSSRNTTPAAVLSVKEEICVQQCANKCVPKEKIDCLEPECENRAECETFPESVFMIDIDAQDIRMTRTEYCQPVVEETPEETAILDRLGADLWPEFLRGGDLQRPPKGALEISGAGGKTTTALLDHGICNIVMSDGPAGVNIANRVKYMEDGSFAIAVIPERYNWGMMKAFAARMIPEGGRPVYRYATAWPVEMLLAQSWNLELLEEIGEAVAKEMVEFGITLWLAPGMNLHRNPLGGRNFEYYSEDPLLTGLCAASITNGVQKTEGTGTVIKHFACNDAEDNRNHSSSNIGERALRELHLRGFEIAVRKSQPAAVMSSYNMINHVYTANSGELLNDILRCEWGFRGVVMTDWGSCNPTAADPCACAPAGNDLIMPGSKEEAEAIREAMHRGELSQECVRACAARVLRMMLKARTPVLI